MGYDFLPLDFQWLALLLFALGYGLGATSRQPRWTLWGLLLYLAAPVPLPRLLLGGVALAGWGWLDTYAERRLRSVWVLEEGS